MKMDSRNNTKPPGVEKVYVKDLKPQMNNFNIKVIVLKRVIQFENLPDTWPLSILKTLLQNPSKLFSKTKCCFSGVIPSLEKYTKNQFFVLTFFRFDFTTMGNYKKRHSSDKLYITQSQWREWGGGLKQAKKQDFKRLPFDCCGLSLRPTVNPYITREGHLFDFVNIFPYIKKFGTNPVTGGKLETKDLIKVRFHKDTDDKYHCPVLFEPFHDNSHIVVIAVSGNVYCMRAIKELCIQNKNMKDLKTEKSFVKEDIIELQNPACLEKFNFTMFDYLKKGIDVKNIIKGEAYDDGWMNGSKTTTSSLNCTANEVGATLKELHDNYKGDEIIKKLAVDYDGMQMKPAMGGDHKASYSTGMVSTSFTSTRMSRHVENRTAIRDDQELRNQWVKKKGYCQVITSLGPLNFELHCDMIPLACENFIKHSKSGYYDNTTFHRLVPDFMVQGGDPTGTGKGGESIYGVGKEKGKEFKDEFRQSLKFNQRGMLAMANNGRHTNKSQFFITFSPQDHLDRMHTIFGKLVGGQEVLNAIENEKRDSKDRPVNDIIIFKINIMVNPFEQADEKIAQLKADEKIKYR